MTQCPECHSDQQYRTATEVASGGGYGPDVLPKLGGRLSSAKMVPVVCGDCGLIRLYASQEARRSMADSSAWVPTAGN